MPFKIRSAKCVARAILVADKRDQTLNVPVIVPHSAVVRLRLVGNKTQIDCIFICIIVVLLHLLIAWGDIRAQLFGCNK